MKPARLPASIIPTSVLYDVGRQADIDYLVMEYLEGETLAQRLSKGPLPIDQVLRYAVEIADALDKAHRNGITRRDLKPGNWEMKPSSLTIWHRFTNLFLDMSPYNRRKTHQAQTERHEA